MVHNALISSYGLSQEVDRISCVLLLNAKTRQILFSFPANQKNCLTKTTLS